MTMALLGRSAYQVAYAVRDLEKAMAFFKGTLGVPAFFVRENNCRDQTDLIYRGKPAMFDYTAAWGYAGDLQIELCLHQSGTTAYSEWLDAGKGPGVHHLGHLLEDDAEYDEAFGYLTDAGFELAMAGRYGDFRWSYFDTVGQIGTYTEIFFLPDSMKSLFDLMKQGDFDAVRATIDAAG